MNRTLQERTDEKNEELRTAFLSEHKCLSKHQHSNFLHSDDNNVVLTLSHEGELLYPDFQFEVDGSVKIVIAELMHLFNDANSHWQLVIWLTSPNKSMRGKKPLLYIDSDPKLVSESAKSMLGDNLY